MLIAQTIWRYTTHTHTHTLYVFVRMHQVFSHSIITFTIIKLPFFKKNANIILFSIFGFSSIILFIILADYEFFGTRNANLGSNGKQWYARFMMVGNQIWQLKEEKMFQWLFQCYFNKWFLFEKITLNKQKKMKK